MRAIACVSSDWKIGNNGRLLYDIPADKKRFRELTSTWVGDSCGDDQPYPTVVMGRKTYESLPGKRPLPGRHNIILSRSIEVGCLAPRGFTIVRSLNDVSMIDIINGGQNQNLWIIGGGELYRELIPWCTDVYITKVMEAAPDADTSFGWDLDHSSSLKFKKTDEVECHDESGLTYSFITYHNTLHGG